MPPASQPIAPFTPATQAPISYANISQLPEALPAMPRETGGSQRGAWNRKADRERRGASPVGGYGSLERAFAACGLIAVGGTTGGAVLALQGYGAAPVVLAASLALLLCACLGMRALDRTQQFQRGEVARVYASALDGPRRAEFERRRSDPTRMEVLTQAMADLVDSLRLSVLGGDHIRTWAVAMRHALDDRAATSRTLAATMSEDAHAIAAAATASRRMESAVGEDLNTLFAHAGRAVQATTTMADETNALQASVRETTVHLRQASSLAVSLADNAMNAQRGVASLTEMTINLLHAADQVKAVLVRAEMVGMNAGIEAAHAGEAGRGFAVVATEVRSLSTSGQQALDAMMLAVRGLKKDAVAMTQTVGVISEGVQAHGALGQALSDAVSHQMEEVSRVVSKAEVARSEIMALQQCATAMERHELGSGGGPAARSAVERLPLHAEAIALILRDLPSFEPAAS